MDLETNLHRSPVIAPGLLALRFFIAYVLLEHVSQAGHSAAVQWVIVAPVAGVVLGLWTRASALVSAATFAFAAFPVDVMPEFLGLGGLGLVLVLGPGAASIDARQRRVA